MAMKKFINKPENIVAELLEGYALAYPDKIHLTENHLVVRAAPKDEGKVGVVTLGGSGCFVSHPEGQLRGDTVACYRVPIEPTQVVDTTGAGDAFNGALAASLALLPARAFADHVRFAVRYASRSTELAGAALSMPRMAAG